MTVRAGGLLNLGCYIQQFNSNTANTSATPLVLDIGPTASGNVAMLAGGSLLFAYGSGNLGNGTTGNLGNTTTINVTNAIAAGLPGFAVISGGTVAARRQPDADHQHRRGYARAGRAEDGQH